MRGVLVVALVFLGAASGRTGLPGEELSPANFSIGKGSKLVLLAQNGQTKVFSQKNPGPVTFDLLNSAEQGLPETLPPYVSSAGTRTFGNLWQVTSDGLRVRGPPALP